MSVAEVEIQRHEQIISLLREINNIFTKPVEETYNNDSNYYKKLLKTSKSTQKIERLHVP